MRFWVILCGVILVLFLIAAWSEWRHNKRKGPWC